MKKELLLALLQVVAADDCAELRLPTLSSGVEGNQGLWDSFVRETMDVAQSPVNATFRIQSLAMGGRFAFFRSPTRQTYLEWQTMAAGNWREAPPLPHPFYLPLNQSRFAEEPCAERISGPVFVYRGFVTEKFQYGHTLHDVLPVMLHGLAQRPAAKIAIQLDPDSIVKRFMEWFLPPDLFDRLLFVPVDRVICADKGLMFLQPSSPFISRPKQLRISELNTHLHQFVLRTHQQFKVEKVIYYQRELNSASHARLLDEAESERVLALARSSLKAYNRPDQIDIFTGVSADGTPVSFKEQYRLFNSAYLAFGTHGTGLSNVLWMQSSCDQLPLVIEFMCSVDTADVRGCYLINRFQHIPRPMTYWRLYGGASWIRYFVVWLLRRDDHPSDFARVDLDGFGVALNKALEFASGPLE